MKRKLSASLILVLLLLMLAAATAWADEQVETLDYYVSDAAGLLSREEWQKLEDAARNISEEYGCGVYVITIKDYRDYNFNNIEACAEAFYKHYQLGRGSEKNGSLLLLSMSERDYALKAYGNVAHTAFTDYGSRRLADSFLDDFRKNDWYGGFADYIRTAGDFLARAAAGDPVDVPQQESPGLSPGAKTVIIIGVPCLIAFCSCSGMKRKMKPVKKQINADEYLIPGGIHLDVEKDTFINRSVTRTVIPTENRSSHSGGGGTTVNSGGFSGHSGKF